MLSAVSRSSFMAIASLRTYRNGGSHSTADTDYLPSMLLFFAAFIEYKNSTSPFLYGVNFHGSRRRQLGRRRSFKQRDKELNHFILIKPCSGTRRPTTLFFMIQYIFTSSVIFSVEILRRVN